MNHFDILLSGDITPFDWCQGIIQQQEKQIYTSLTSSKDFNHIVKTHVYNIHQYLKERGLTSFKELNAPYEPFKEALNILYKYLLDNPAWKPSTSKPLSNDEVNDAFKDLHVDQVVPSYITCDRKFNDPQINGQTYALYSFIPSKTVQPDSDGLYGFIKIRGVFSRIEEAEERSKELIQYFSANQIFICEVGKPVPLEQELKTKKNVTYIDHPNREEQTLKLADLVGDQTLKEKKEIENILERKKLLKDDVAKTPQDKTPIDKYIELHVKRATNSFSYIKGQKQLENMKNIIIKTREEIADMDNKYPNLKDEYIEHYSKAKQETGIDQATDEMALYIKEHVMKDYGLEF